MLMALGFGHAPPGMSETTTTTSIPPIFYNHDIHTFDKRSRASESGVRPDYKNVFVPFEMMVMFPFYLAPRKGAGASRH